ncbi:hypothetical protein IV203_009768 [Nitzschia inconspicua]|uniref:Uncharacterized protein n=1 Tax=Nitzschia inconspicua TaxID=303405 RepID=A0A9K3KUU3_9STRA|nr:hypothetical protein IV203_009768 [Nitzschia inconspicua]
MRGLKLLSVSALAGNEHAFQRPESRSLVQESFTTIDEPLFGRRKALQSILAGASVVASFPSMSSALDIDAFTNSELEKDTKNCNPKLDPKCAPKMTQDEALCKYGQSGNARGEACKRFKESGGQLPTSTKEKSLGGAYAI